ncbi:MAG: DUF3187 family protein [Burkholderiales bacterium]
MSASSGWIASAILAIAGMMHAPPLLADDGGYFGLLRARDLSPFGFLRLDMRPAHAVAAPAGTWGIEMELAYQNTWAVTPAVNDYLDSLVGRRELGGEELEAIRGLPGENYLVDLELAELDVTFHHKFSTHWGGYVVLSAVSYDGGFLDGTIEQFHDTFGFNASGRPSLKRNDVNVIFDLNSVQLAMLEAPVSGGLLDPTIGVRFSGIELPKNWILVLEAAAKLPIQGQRLFLSTGKTDVGIQATLQRLSQNHALYVSAAAVHYDGKNSITPTPARIVPTLVVGYERRMGTDTHLILQGYMSSSIYSRNETDLTELLATKYQLSLGVYKRKGSGVVSLAITENVGHFSNTPDVGVQLGWAYSPALRAAN